MKFCEECGVKLPDGAKYCPECGTKVVHPTVAEQGSIPEAGNPFRAFGMTGPAGTVGAPAFGGADPFEYLDRDVRAMLAAGKSYGAAARRLERSVGNLRGGGKAASRCVEDTFLPRADETTEPFYRWLLERYEKKSKP
ncbi:MAG: zinc ribbon domain-containing protein [Clostridia bacterium]|nr:zinc ribbon domain-containing protein [Clostridia bacterium]